MSQPSTIDTTKLFAVTFRIDSHGNEHYGANLYASEAEARIDADPVYCGMWVSVDDGEHAQRTSNAEARAEVIEDLNAELLRRGHFGCDFRDESNPDYILAGILDLTVTL